MLLIHCPWCGERAESEFNYGGEAGIVRPIDAASKDKGTWLSDEQWGDYVFMRKNTRGVFREQWVHTHGCRRWFEAERDTQTYEFLSVTPMKSRRIVSAEDGKPAAPAAGAPVAAQASPAPASQPAPTGQTGKTTQTPAPTPQAPATTPSSSEQAASPAAKADQAPQGDA